MSEDRVRELLTAYAKAHSAEADEWDLVFTVNRHQKGTDEWEAMRDHYRQTAKSVARLATRTALQLIDLGYPVYTWEITGQAPSGINHYDIDDAIKAEFGDEVIVDSENGQLFIYTTDRVREPVFARVKEMAGSGEVVLYSGDRYPSSFTQEKMEPNRFIIKGMGNWTQSKNYLKGVE